VEGKEVDKERWLPLRERSYYKPDKKKKGAKRNIAQGSSGATQGGRVENENPVMESAQTKMGVAVAAFAAGGGGGGQAKKKKKKGAKW